MAVPLPRDFGHDIARADDAAFEDAGKYAFPGHDAIADGFIDGTMVVTFLADQVVGTSPQHSSVPGQGREIEAVDDEIFAESAEFHLAAAAAERLDAFQAKQADLSVPVFPA